MTYADAIIPEGNTILLPCEPNLVLWRRVNESIQIVQNSIALRLRYANNAPHKPGIHKQALPSRNGVSTDDGVLSYDRLPADGLVFPDRRVGLFLGGMKGGKALEVFLECWRKGVVGGILGGPKSITTAATRWPGEEFEGGVRGRVDFVCNLFEDINSCHSK